ncbi:MAG: TetR/AcrR family transcriptional regulator [Spirochaetales bacterium]|nr:TetR/AcrR family transcriptional regulator [Spirochaetales bacterium]
MEEEKGNIKERILAITARLFAEKGYDGISTDEIAREAKINKSMIYYYFSSKEGLLISLIQQNINIFEESMNNADIPKQGTIRSIIESIISFAIEYISQNRNIMLILLQETMLKVPKSKIDIINFITPIWEKFESSIRQNFSDIQEASLVDKHICISLIFNYVLMLSRIDNLDEAAVQMVKELYINRVSRIIELILSSGNVKGTIS